MEDSIDETIAAFEFLKAQGKIRYYGISSIRPNVIRKYVKRSDITSVMMQYSLADRRPEEEILGLLAENNIGVLARGSLAQGMLVDKPAKEYLGHSASAIDKARLIIQLLVNDNRTAAQAALRFVIANPSITSAIVGVSRREQLNEIAGTMESDELTVDEFNILRLSMPAKVYDQHR